MSGSVTLMTSQDSRATVGPANVIFICKQGDSFQERAAIGIDLKQSILVLDLRATRHSRVHEEEEESHGDPPADLDRSATTRRGHLCGCGLTVFGG